MRAKELRLIITFDTTAQAMAMERFCKEHGLAGRLIPVPRQITAGCGLAWSAPPEKSQELGEMLEAAGISWNGWRELMV